MIKVALVISALFLFVSCETSENTQIGDSVMQGGLSLNNALIKANDTQSIAHSNGKNMTEITKAAIRLTANETDLVSESNVLGIYKPFYPKADKWIRYSFETVDIHTTVFTYLNDSKARNIYIKNADNQFITPEFQLDLKDLNITYLDYHSRKSETNTDLYDADFAYRSNDHEDILVGFRAIDLTESAISKYDKFESLPKNITSIRVYSSLENEK
ncbi:MULTISPECIES: hypothetical protein [Psychrobacter]|jgi:hypothetical protein|uniref:hypothetical protein n=2 Tax=Psychrobacter TaxID=497 RepID=UPI0004080490|nr:hypothetical protein [Psychrobacter immobilis]